MKKLKASELENGEIYYLGGWSGYIFKLDYIEGDKIYASCHIYIKGKEFRPSSYLASCTQSGDIRPASRKEENWLNSCIAVNEYISFENIEYSESNYQIY